MTRGGDPQKPWQEMSVGERVLEVRAALGDGKRRIPQRDLAARLAKMTGRPTNEKLILRWEKGRQFPSDVYQESLGELIGQLAEDFSRESQEGRPLSVEAAVDGLAKAVKALQETVDDQFAVVADQYELLRQVARFLGVPGVAERAPAKHAQRRSSS